MVKAESKEWPDWWNWPLEITAHLLRRMEERSFSEVDLRGMLEEAQSMKPDWELGRWAIEAVYEGHTWEIIVEPEESSQLLIVVTAYRISD